MRQSGGAHGAGQACCGQELRCGEAGYPLVLPSRLWARAVDICNIAPESARVGGAHPNPPVVGTHPVLARSCVDALNPDGPPVPLLKLSPNVGMLQRLFYS